MRRKKNVQNYHIEYKLKIHIQTHMIQHLWKIRVKMSKACDCYLATLRFFTSSSLPSYFSSLLALVRSFFCLRTLLLLLFTLLFHRVLFRFFLKSASTTRYVCVGLTMHRITWKTLTILMIRHKA